MSDYDDLIGVAKMVAEITGVRRSPTVTDAMVERAADIYSEIELIRRQLKTGNAMARAAAARLGYQMDPRIAAARAAAVEETR